MKVHLGQKVAALIKEKGLIKTRVSEKIGLQHPQHLFRIFEMEDMNTERVRAFSLALDYNLFYYLMFDERLLKLKQPADMSQYAYGDTLPLMMEPDVTYGNMKRELAGKDKEIRELKDEILSLHRALRQKQEL